MLLRRFAGADGRVWQHDKEGKFGPDPRLPKDVGGETHLYAPVVGGQRIPDDVEQWLAEQVDDAAGTSFDRVESESSSFSDSDRLRIARFLAALDMRTPGSRDWLSAMFDTTIRNSTADYHAAQRGIFLEHGQLVPLDEIQAVAEANAEDVVSRHLPTAWLDYLKQTLPLATERVARGAWSLIRAPVGSEFITSDLGVAKLSGITTFASHNFGFVGEVTHWAVPLSPAHVLMVAGDPGEGRVLEAEQKWVDALNARLAADTPRFIYSRTRMDPAILFPIETENESIT